MIYLIRHAEKLDDSIHAKLTAKGLADSLKYGEKLKLNRSKIDLIISSPIERCMQTAYEISKGYRRINIESSTLLGNPGVFINNGEEAMQIFNTYKLVDIINMQLSKKNLKGFNDIESSVKDLLYLMDKKGDNVLYISHDAIITPLISYISNEKYIIKDDIVNYLDGYFTNLENLANSWKPNNIFVAK